MIHRIIDEIKRSKTICVVGHVRPDGDCIGSQLGMTLALKSLGKKVYCWNEDPVPQKLAFLDPKKSVQPPKRGVEFDLVIATDCASFERLGKVGNCIRKRKSFINIDHHPSNTHYADINWISSEQSSTGELIFQLMKTAHWEITPSIADCLFTAISTDTGSFQYQNTRQATFQVAGELVERGANLSEISNQVYHSYPLGRVRLLKHIYSTFKLVEQNRIAYFWLRRTDFARTKAGPSDSEGLIDHIRAIQPVLVACVFEEAEADMIRVSLRSKSKHIDVNQIASQFGGGGHQAAAGARVQGTPASVQRRVLGTIKKALRSAKINQSSK